MYNVRSIIYCTSLYFHASFISRFQPQNLVAVFNFRTEQSTIYLSFHMQRLTRIFAVFSLPYRYVSPENKANIKSLRTLNHREIKWFTVFALIWDFTCVQYCRTLDAGWRESCFKGEITGVDHCPWCHSTVSMWSVKTVPKVNVSLSGLGWGRDVR